MILHLSYLIQFSKHLRPYNKPKNDMSPRDRAEEHTRLTVLTQEGQRGHREAASDSVKG